MFIQVRCVCDDLLCWLYFTIVIALVAGFWSCCDVWCALDNCSVLFCEPPYYHLFLIDLLQFLVTIVLLSVVFPFDCRENLSYVTTFIHTVLLCDLLSVALFLGVWFTVFYCLFMILEASRGFYLGVSSCCHPSAEHLDEVV